LAIVKAARRLPVSRPPTGGRRGDLGSNPCEGRGAPLFVAVDQQHVPAPMSEHGCDIDGEQGFADSAFDVANREDHGRTLSGFRGDGVCTSPP
jgi:hypothetical protein